MSSDFKEKVTFKLESSDHSVELSFDAYGSLENYIDNFKYFLAACSFSGDALDRYYGQED